MSTWIFVCACVYFCSSFVFLAVCVHLAKGPTIAFTLPSKGYASAGSSGRKSALIPAFRSYLTPGFTLPCEYSGLFMSQMPCRAQCTCLKEAMWGWLLWKVSNYSPSPSCFLVLQGWFHLRSSCLCCSLITINFLEGNDTLYHEDSS